MTPIPPFGPQAFPATFEGESGSPDQTPEPQSGDDFASMLATIWFSPVAVQLSQAETPTPTNVSVEPLPVNLDATTKLLSENSLATSANSYPESPSATNTFPQPALEIEIDLPVTMQGKFSPLAPRTESTFPTPYPQPDVAFLSPTVETATTGPVEAPLAAQPETSKLLTPQPGLVETKDQVPSQEAEPITDTTVPVIDSQLPESGKTKRPPGPILPHPPVKEDPKSFTSVPGQTAIQTLPSETKPTGAVATTEWTPQVTATVTVVPEDGTNKPDSMNELNPEVVRNSIAKESVQREANLMASYLAEATRANREHESSPIRIEFAANSMNSDSSARQNAERFAESEAADVPVNSIAFDTAVKQASKEKVEPANTQAATQIVALAETVAVRQMRSVRLRLRPQELGTVDVQLSRDSRGRVSVEMTPERENTRLVLSQSIEQLREALQRAGLTVDRLQVRTDTPSLLSGDTTAHNHSHNTQSVEARTRSQASAETETETRPLERVSNHKLLSLSA